MMALSAVDCALWDLRGNWFGTPVCQPSADPPGQVPAYASALGYSLILSSSRKRARKFVADGFKATKWFFQRRPDRRQDGDGAKPSACPYAAPERRPGRDIMLDCWMSWMSRTPCRWPAGWKNMRPAGWKSRFCRQNRTVRPDSP